MDITRTLNSVLILDAGGKRLLSKYFDDKDNVDAKQFEKKLFVKTKKYNYQDEILNVDGFLVFHRFLTDLHIYVVGNKSENPLLLDSVINCLVEVITSLVGKSNVERRSLLDHLGKVILAFDEMCDNGMILETDSNLVLHRIGSKNEVVEQTMAQKLQSATGEYIKLAWMRS